MECNYCRVCKYCDEIYDTPEKHSKVCPECKDKNHEVKVINNLFN